MFIKIYFQLKIKAPIIYEVNIVCILVENLCANKLTNIWKKSYVVELVKRLLSTPKVPGSNPREAKKFYLT